MIGFGQNVYIPDANFKAYLVGNAAINTNGDAEIQVSEAAIFGGGINCSNWGIFDLTGIDAFTNLDSLLCDSNSLIYLDITSNGMLRVLSCSHNALTSLDVSSNLALSNLYCQNNQLTSLDVSANLALTHLNCGNIVGGNLLTSLDVSANLSLTDLRCFSNQLTSLDVSSNLALTYLWCQNNQLTSLDVSANLALTHLFCFSNQLTSLDLSSNLALIRLRCNSNQLTSLDLRNGNNTNLPINSYLNLTNNPQLFCIDVDDPVYSTANWLNIDAWASFSSNCATALGCTDPNACNYDALATIDDSSCIYGISSSSYDTLLVAANIVWNGDTLNVSGDYSDTLINSAGCDSIAYLNLTITNTTGILDLTSKKQIVKIIDMLGQKTPYKRNTPLFYIYDDGTVEKRIVIE